MTPAADVDDLLRRGSRLAVVTGDVVPTVPGALAGEPPAAVTSEPPGAAPVGVISAGAVPAGALTFHDLAVATAEIAAGLRDRGLGPGDRVVAALGSGPAFVALALGTLAAGATFVPLHPGWWPRELEATIELAAPRLVVADAALSGSALRHVPHLAVPGPEATRAAPIGAGPARDLLAPLRRHGATTDGPLVGPGAGLVVATSGSTAEPRLFEFTEEQLRRFWLAPATAAPGRVADREVTSWTPLAHAPTLRFALVRLLAGATVVVTNRWTPKRAADGLRRRPTDALWATTPQLLAVRRRLARPHGSTSGEPVARLVRHAVHAGGGLVDETRRARLQACFGAPVVAVYTSTEAGGWVTALDTSPAGPETHPSPAPAGAGGAAGVAVGALAPGIVLTAGAGEDSGPTTGAAGATDDGAASALYVSGPAAAVHTIGGPRRAPAGWPLGDLGSVEGELVRLVGRSGDRFHCDGRSVDAALVELRLAADERLDDVAVIPRPDPERGAIGVAVTVPADPEHPPFLHDLRAAADPHDDEPPWPEAQWVVDTLPLSVAGHVHRRLLTFEESSR